MARVRVAFTDFWQGFHPVEFGFPEGWSTRHEFEVVSPRDADLLIYSKFGHSNRSFVGTKLFLTVENLRPRWRDADFCIGFDHLQHERYLRLPYFAILALKDRVQPLALLPATPRRRSARP